MESTEDNTLGAAASAMLGWQVSTNNNKKQKSEKDISIFAMLQEKAKKNRFVRWD